MLCGSAILHKCSLQEVLYFRVIKNTSASNTILVVYVLINNEYLESYEPIAEDLKYVTNSLIRLKILATLYEQPLNMKDLNIRTGLSYSSISANMHDLEIKGYVYRESNKYHVSNAMKLQIENILELNDIVCLINEFFNIFDAHCVDMIPNDSIAELYLLGMARILESDGIDAYKTYNYIEKSLKSANYVKCIFPFYYENFNKQLNVLHRKDVDVEILVPEEVSGIFDETLKTDNIKTFKGEYNFLLISTDKVMILGFFRDDGFFDQNRLLTSKYRDCLKWADNLFENFKKEINK